MHRRYLWQPLAFPLNTCVDRKERRNTPWTTLLPDVCFSSHPTTPGPCQVEEHIDKQSCLRVLKSASGLCYPYATLLTFCIPPHHLALTYERPKDFKAHVSITSAPQPLVAVVVFPLPHQVHFLLLRVCVDA